jgi:hypothetical protein
LVSARHAPARTASSTKDTLAAAKRSNGAPSAICFSSNPVEPKEKMTFWPVLFS